MPYCPLSWPPNSGPIERWWYAPTTTQWLALPYHAAPRLKLVEQWLHGFQQASSTQKVRWLERLISLCHEDPNHAAYDLLTRFVKRLLQAPEGIKAVLDIRLILTLHRQNETLLAVLETVLMQLFNPKSLHINLLSPAHYRLQWQVYFGARSMPPELAQPDSDLINCAFVHPFLQQPILWLPLIWRGRGRAALQTLCFTHLGLQGFNGAGGFIHRLYRALNEQFAAHPALSASVSAPLPDNASDATLSTWIKHHPLVAWHFQQGAQLTLLETHANTLTYHFLYEFERLSYAQSEWAMARLVRR